MVFQIKMKSVKKYFYRTILLLLVAAMLTVSFAGCKNNKNDIPDYEIMKQVGVATCPADAAIEIKGISDYISHLAGGHGCVRDVIEQVLRLHDNWFHPDAVNW